MIGILGGMGTQAGLDFCNKLAMLNRGKIDQEYPLFMLYNKSNIPGRPESIGVQTRRFTDLPTKFYKVIQNIIRFLKAYLKVADHSRKVVVNLLSYPVIRLIIGTKI